MLRRLHCALGSAIADCFTALEIVGRRVTEDIPLNEMSSVADYGLNVAVVRGGPIYSATIWMRAARQSG